MNLLEAVTVSAAAKRMVTSAVVRGQLSIVVPHTDGGLGQITLDFSADKGDYSGPSFQAPAVSRYDNKARTLQVSVASATEAKAPDLASLAVNIAPAMQALIDAITLEVKRAHMTLEVAQSTVELSQADIDRAIKE
jgi:hypothetical protein